MGAFSRSWKLAKLSFGVIGKDKEILAFPIVGGFLGVILVVIILILRLFNIIVSTLQGGSEAFGVMDFLLVVIGYFGLVFITVFTEACVVYTAKKRLQGGDAGFFESIGVAFSKFPALIGWSLITGTVGLLLKILENAVEKAKGAGKFIMLAMTSLLGLAWTVLTAFVVQGIVIDSAGPFEAIKESSLLLKKTWGERVIRQFGFGAVVFILALIGALILVPLFVVAIISSSGVGAGIVMAIGVLYIFGLILLFEVAEDVYMTALYIYATTGKIPEGFDEEVMSEAFKTEESKNVIGLGI